MPPEMVFFHSGLSTDTRSSLQKPGFLKSVENILMEIEGVQTLRPFFFPVNTTAIDPVHSLKYWRGMVLEGDGNNLRVIKTESDFIKLYSGFNNSPWQFKVYKDFITATNGKNFILVDENMNVYPARIDNPQTAPYGEPKGLQSLTGVYRLYVSYYVVWPNGHTYETGLSPASGDVTVDQRHIMWSNIPICPYAPYYGQAPTIYRNLYRGPGTGGNLTEIYYVTTISDNTTTTYDDDVSDATLQTGYIENNLLYVPPIVPKLMEWHYGRLFMIDPTFTNRLYYTEVALGNTAEANEELMPLAMEDLNWDDLRVAGFDEVDPQGIVSWGSYIYIALRQTWIRKQGDDPNTWAFRKTYSSHGIAAPWTIDTSSMGIFGLINPENGESGIALFNGQYSEVFSSPRLDELLKNDLNIDQIAQCRGRLAGKYYFLLYPSIGQTDPDKILAIDLRRYPDIRVAYWTDLYGQSLDTDKQSSKFYIGGSDGYVRTKSSTGTCDFLIETHDLMGGDPKATNEIKTWKEIKYALDTGTQTVILQVYIDDVLMQWPDGTTEKTISGTGEMTQLLRSLPSNWQGYRMRLLITGNDMEKFEIYSPWKLDFEIKI